MPDVSPLYRLIMIGRRYPRLYGSFKIFYDFFFRTVPTLLINILRPIVRAGVVRFGPPRGSFSFYTTPVGWPAPASRIVLHDQGVLEVLPDSLLVRCGLWPCSSPPWPHFWGPQPK